MVRVLRLIACALALALGLAGPGLVAGARAADVVMRVGYIPVAGIGQLFVIQAQGWAKERGIDIKTVVFDSGPNMIQGLASGTIDAYLGGVGPLAVARGKGLDVKVVAATAIEELVVLGGPKLSAAFTGDAAAAFRDTAKTLGRPVKIGTQPAGSIPNTMLQYWLWEVAKVDKASVEIVPMGIDATQQAIMAGAIDAATVREPALTIIRDRNPAIHILATGGEMFPHQPGSVLGFTGAFLKDHPEAAQSFVDLMVRATTLLTYEPKKAAPALVTGLGKGLVDEATMARALVSPASKFIVDPRIIADGVAKMQEFQVRIGVLNKVAPLDDLFDASLFLKAAK